MVGLCVFGLAAQAWASEISWTFQRVEQVNPGPSPMLSLGMRTGATWPTVFYEAGSQNGLTAGSLTPVGWTKTSMDLLSTPSYVRSAAGTDGRLGAAWQMGGSTAPHIQFAQLTSAGWQYSTVGNLQGSPQSNGANAPDIAYLPGNRPVVAYADITSKVQVAVKNATGWESQTVSFPTSGPINGQFVSTAVNSQGNIGLAYYSSSRLVYAEKSVPGGSWGYVDLYGMSVPKNISLAYGPNDQVGVAVLQGTGLSYIHFDVQSGCWQNDILETAGVVSNRVDLVFNNAGHPCLSYVGTDGLVHYRTDTGSGWADILLPTGTDMLTGLNITPTQASDAALALDRDGIPVISYYTQSGLVLAYDPIVAPEPATLLAMAAGVALISRRRRQS
jgi:hypothetical protein